MKKLIFIFFAVIIAKQVSAQQDPQYTQYMYNMNIINPAYAGISEGLSVGALYRSQWVGLDGGPETFTFNIHSPVGKQVGLGLSVISDQIGPVNETNAYVDFSYTIPVNVSMLELLFKYLTLTTPLLLVISTDSALLKLSLRNSYSL